MLYRDFPAPKLPIGANVLVSDIGAYTTVSATRFNGFEPAAVLGVNKRLGDTLKMALWQLT